MSNRNLSQLASNSPPPCAPSACFISGNSDRIARVRPKSNDFFKFVQDRQSATIACSMQPVFNTVIGGNGTKKMAKAIVRTYVRSQLGGDRSWCLNKLVLSH